METNFFFPDADLHFFRLLNELWGQSNPALQRRKKNQIYIVAYCSLSWAQKITRPTLSGQKYFSQKIDLNLDRSGNDTYPNKRTTCLFKWMVLVWKNLFDLWNSTSRRFIVIEDDIWTDRLNGRSLLQQISFLEIKLSELSRNSEWDWSISTTDGH